MTIKQQYMTDAIQLKNKTNLTKHINNKVKQ